MGNGSHLSLITALLSLCEWKFRVAGTTPPPFAIRISSAQSPAERRHLGQRQVLPTHKCRRGSAAVLPCCVSPNNCVLFEDPQWACGREPSSPALCWRKTGMDQQLSHRSPICGLSPSTTGPVNAVIRKWILVLESVGLETSCALHFPTGALRGLILF